MKKVMLLFAAGLAALSLFASTAADIEKLESGGPLAIDPSEKIVAAPQDMKLILCIGQSNMAGRGKMTDEDRVIVPNAYKLNRDGQWVAAKSPYHFDRAYAGVGPVDGFVKLYLQDHPGETVGVVPCAVGGSAMKTWDCTRSGKCGANLRSALARAHIAASNGTFIAVLWHQGETDAAKSDAESLMKSYPGRVKAMMERIRTEFGNSNLPLIVGEIGRWMRKDGDHAARINPAIDAIPTLLSHSACVSSEGLAHQDAHHFDRASQSKLAERYYSAWKDLSSLPYVATWRGNRAAAVSFTFDDGIRDQYELAFPKMKALGIRGTFFLNGGSIESQKPTKQGALRMTWDMVKEMSDAGMEMSNHGLNHVNHGRNSREAVEVDIASNDVLIARHTGKKPITFAYPNNSKNKEWSAALVNPGRVGSRTHQTSFGGKHTVESGRKLYQKAKAERTWLVLMTHAVQHGYDQWRDPECFYTLLADAAGDKDLWVDTFAAVAIYERLRNETKVVVTPAGSGWHVAVTPPKLDRNLFASTLDLVLPDGTIRSFDPFGGDFDITLPPIASVAAAGKVPDRGRPIPQAQGTHVNPDGHTIEVTTKCICIDGVPTVGVMGEMHYSRVPVDEWRDYVDKMKAGGVTTLAAYVFWNHHEWAEGQFDFSGRRDLGAFLEVCEEARMPVVLRLGPWCHGEAREGGFPDWLVAKKGLKLRSTDRAYLGYVERFWREVFKRVDGHLYKQGGCVVGVQLENECRGPWPYMMALKNLVRKVGFDVPYYTRTGWPKMQGKVDYGEILPLFGDYADGFWERRFEISPRNYRDAFVFKTTRTSANIATEQLKASELGSDAKDVAAYPYLTCELGGGMPSSYQRRLQTFPMDAFAMAVVKLGSGSNLLGYYMYAGGTNPNNPKEGVFFNEEVRGRFTNHNDLPPFSYEFYAPIGEFGDLAPHYHVLKELHAFCAKYGAELAVEDPVIVSSVEARRGRFVFHNEYVRGQKDDGACWIAIDGKKVLDGQELCREAVASSRRMERKTAVTFKKIKDAEPFVIETKDVGGKSFPLQPRESDWSKAAVYELDIPAAGSNALLQLDYIGDVARVYVDDVPVADDFYKGLPMKAGLWRYPSGKVTVRILPWQDSSLVYVQDPFRPKKTGAELISAQLVVRSHTFEIGDRDFLLDGQPFTIRCGEMHYARVPRAYWRHRLQMLRAMGCNAVGCYMFWNYHERERGVFTWTDRADAAAFCRLAQEEGLWVILRPGPYSCAEWEGGGAPWWLMEKGIGNREQGIGSGSEIRMRSSDPRWLEPAKRWITEVGRQLAPLQITRGGPILMVQVENEYGLHGNDTGYIRALREATLAAGFEVPLYACNPPRVMQNGFIPELFQAANFGGDPEARFGVLRQYQKKGPLMCAEYYPAWFDTWGQAHHPPKNDRAFFGPIDWMLKNRTSFSLYMAHGGTSFGGWTGCRNPFVPNVTSYDYEAPISEQGRANPSYAKFRERAAAHLNPGETIPEMPAPIPVKNYGTIAMMPSGGVEQLVTRAVTLDEPVYMEHLGQGFGLVSYEREIGAEDAGELSVDEVHDFGYVFLDGAYLGTLDRRHRGLHVNVPSGKAGTRRNLSILLEAMGRINSSQGMEDHKGLSGRVRLGGKVLSGGWLAKLMPIDPDGWGKKNSTVQPSTSNLQPSFYRGELTVEGIPADTFLDMRGWRKGIAWVNGHNLGRYWSIGPQQTLYVPGCWLKEGLNDIMVLDFFSASSSTSQSARTLLTRDTPILDELHLETDFNRHERSKSVPTADLVVTSGHFKNTDEAQVVMFDKPVTSDVFKFSITKTYDKRNLASVSEFDLLDEKGNPLTALGLSIAGVSSEEEISADGVAENAIDGQVEACWMTSSRALPHWIVLKSVATATIGGFRYTPNVRNVGRVADWSFSVSREKCK